MKVTLIFSLLIFLVSISLPAFSQDSLKIIYPENYRFNPGDDVEWSKPDFDDSNWKDYNLKEFPSDQWKGFGWMNRHPARQYDYR